MKRIETNGITYLELMAGSQNAWYYGISYEHGDLYEAEELFHMGKKVEGRKLILIHYPDGRVYQPVEKAEGEYLEVPVYYDGGIFVLNVSFTRDQIEIIRFDCQTHTVDKIAALPLETVKNCYNLRLHTRPLTLTRQGNDDMFEIIYPERVSFKMGEHESFFLRDQEKLYFSRWTEEGEGDDYLYYEETVVRSLKGEILEILPGDICLMPHGEFWYLQ